jgi:putative transposase
MYHVTCRGNERRKIFIDNVDRYRFQTQLKESLTIYQVVLHAYVMMGNHFHLVVQTLRPNLSEFMRRFNISYTSWINYHHNTCGHLYQGRYNALLVDADNYLLELSRYVHLNPIRTRIFAESDYKKRWAYVRRYRWSSLPGYIDQRYSSDLITYSMTLQMIGGRNSYRRFLVNGLKKGVVNPFEDVQYQTILGEDDFVARVKNEYLEQGSLREQPVYRDMITEKVSPKLVLERVARVLDADVQTFAVRLGNGMNRGIMAELLYRYSGITQQEIGRLLGGITYTAVSMLRNRFKAKMLHDKSLKLKYAKAEQSLRNV